MHSNDKVLRAAVHDVLASGAHAVGIYTMRVQGPDRGVEWRHVNVCSIRGGKIVEVWRHPFEQDTFDEFFAWGWEKTRPYVFAGAHGPAIVRPVCMSGMNTAILDVDIDYPTAGLIRPVSDEERAAYERDGAAIVKGVIPGEWVEFMRAAVTRMIEESDPSSQNYADDGDPRFFSLTFPWMFDDAFKAWAIRGPLKHVARQVMADAREVIFFYDQIFAKEPGATKRTPWHQDLPFLPVKGDQQIRIWVPFDTVTADGGAIHYLRGSHRWGKVYHPIGFKNIPIITDTHVNSPYEDMPDFEALYDTYDWLVAEAEPGDLLLHHPRTVHGSLGNLTDRFRRAITSFYVGDQATWNPHVANMFNNKSLTGHVTAPDLAVGGPIECEMFPRVWP